MSDYTTLKTAIDANINTNGNQEITGAVLNSVLNQMIDDVQDQTDAQFTELKLKTDFFENLSDIVIPPYIKGKGVNSKGEYFDLDAYAYYAPILIKSGEGVVLNDWENTYLGDNVSIIYECDESGNFIKPLLIGNGDFRIATYENRTESDKYIGISCVYENLNYRLGKILSINKVVKNNKERINKSLAKTITLADLGIRRRGYYINANDGGQYLAENCIITQAIYLNTNDVIKAYTSGDGIALIVKTEDAPSDESIYTPIKNAWGLLEPVNYVVKDAGYYSFCGRSESLFVNINKYIDAVDTEEKVETLLQGHWEKAQYTLDDLIFFGALNGYYLNNIQNTIFPAADTVVTQPIFLYKGDEVKCSTGGTGFILFSKIDKETIDTTSIGFISIPQNINAVEYEGVLSEDGWYVFSGRVNRTDGTNLKVSINSRKKNIPSIFEQLNRKSDKSNAIYRFSIGTAVSEGADCVKNQIPEIPWFDSVPNDGTTYGTYLDDKVDSVPQGDSFIFISDVHYSHNKKESARLIDYVRRRLGIKTIIHGGDVLNESPLMSDAAKEWLNFNRDFVFRIGTDFKQVCGDHDHNGRYASDGQALSYSFIQKCMNGYNIKELVYDTLYDKQVDEVAKENGWTDEDMREYDAWKKMHYYFDDVTINTRFVVLHTGWTGNVGLAVDKLGSAVLDENNALYLQMDFLYYALITCPQNMNIVIVGHNVMVNPKYFVSTESGEVARYNVNELQWIGQWEQVVKMVKAFKEKESICLYYRDWSGLGIQAKSFNFLDATTPKNVICIGGDVHWDILGKYSNNELQVIKKATTLDNIITTEGVISKEDILLALTITDGIDTRYYGIIEAPQSDYDDSTDSALLAPPKVAGTLTAQAFDIITMTEGAIYFTRIGSGEDRKISIL